MLRDPRGSAVLQVNGGNANHEPRKERKDMKLKSIMSARVRTKLLLTSRAGLAVRTPRTGARKSQGMQKVCLGVVLGIVACSARVVADDEPVGNRSATPLATYVEPASSAPKVAESLIAS